jgi:ABC-type dipeptide/oligopeptide/nickel transport system permease component
MRRFLLRRLLALLLVLLGVTLLSFLLLYVVPGDPVQAVAGERYDEAVLAELRAELHLDDPLPLRYGRFLAELARGDLGVSYVSREPVRDAIAATFPHTLRLALAAMLIAVLLGVGLGVAAAARPGSPLDRAAMLLASAALLLYVVVRDFGSGLPDVPRAAAARTGRTGTEARSTGSAGGRSGSPSRRRGRSGRRTP